MSAPRLLDLFCCAGGAATGYARAYTNHLGAQLLAQIERAAA